MECKAAELADELDKLKQLPALKNKQDFLSSIEALQKTVVNIGTTNIDIQNKLVSNTINKQRSEELLNAGTLYDITTISKEELAQLKRKNNEYIKKHKVTIQESNQFTWNNGIIQVDKNETNEANYQVFLAHEIIHDRTANWIAEHMHDKDIKFLQKIIDTVLKDIGKDITKLTPEKMLIWDRLNHGNEGIERVQENVAVLAAEPDVKKALLDLYPDNRNLLQKIIGKIRTLFTKTEQVTAQKILRIVRNIQKKAKKQKNTIYETPSKKLAFAAQKLLTYTKIVSTSIIHQIMATNKVYTLQNQKVIKILQWVVDENNQHTITVEVKAKNKTFVKKVNYLIIDGIDLDTYLNVQTTKPIIQVLNGTVKEITSFVHNNLGLIIPKKEKTATKQQFLNKYKEYGKFVDSVILLLQNKNITHIYGYALLDNDESYDTDYENKIISLPITLLKKALNNYQKNPSKKHKYVVTAVRGIIAHELIHVFQGMIQNHQQDIQKLEFAAHRAELYEYYKNGFTYDDAIQFMFDGTYAFTEDELITGILDPAITKSTYQKNFYSDKENVNNYNNLVIQQLISKKITINETPDIITGVSINGKYILLTTQNGLSLIVDPTTYTSIDGKYVITTQGLFDTLVFGTKAETLTQWSSYDRIEQNLFNDSAAMLDLLDKLNQLDNGVDQNTLKYYKQLLTRIPAEWFNDTAIYIKEKASKAAGVYSNNKIGLHITSNKKYTNSAKSNSEVYIHEILHALSVHLFESNDPKARKLVREIEYIHRELAKKLHKHSFVDITAENQELEKLASEQLYNQMFGSKNTLEEFYAIALSNPTVKKLFEKMNIKMFKERPQTIFQSLINILYKALKFIIGHLRIQQHTTNIDERLQQLFFEISEANYKALQKSKQNNIFDRLSLGFLQLDMRTSNFLKNQISKLSLKTKNTLTFNTNYEVKPKSFSSFIKTIKIFANLTMHEKGLEILQDLLDRFHFKPWGDIQRIIQDLSKSDKFAQTIEWLALHSDRIDQFRNTIIQATQLNILDSFSRNLTPEEKTLITEVLVKTDLQCLLSKFKYTQLIALLENNVLLDSTIKNIKNEIIKKDKKFSNFLITQTNGLGYYMVSGKGHIAQNKNAEAIASLVLTTHRRKANPELVSLIDKLASLQSLKYIQKYKKLKIAALMKTESKGIKTVLKTHSAAIQQAINMSFMNQTLLMEKGYIKTLYDYNLNLEIAPIDQKKKLEALGYKLVYTLNTNDKFETKKGYFIRYELENNDHWYRTAMRLTSMQNKGTTFSRIYTNENLADNDVESAELRKHNADILRNKYITQMMHGVFDPIKENLAPIMPLIDEYGNVTDYRIIMPNKIKQEVLQQNLDIFDVLPHTMATIMDKNMSEKQNIKVFETLFEDSKQNYIPNERLGKNNKIYVEIDENSPYQAIKDIYQIIPSKYKELIKKHKFAVRADLLYDFFGFRHLDLEKIIEKKLQKNLNNEGKLNTNKTLSTIFNTINKNGLIVKSTNIVETILHRLSSLVKVLILLKMPVVITHNIVSNIMYALNTHTNPLELVKLYISSTKDAITYVRLHRQLIQLQIQLLNIPNNDKIKSQITSIKKALSRNPIHELATIGVYQAIQEDITNKEIRSKDRFKQLLDNHIFNKIPTFIRTGTQILFLTDETSYYKATTEAIQLSDLIARDVQNRKMKQIEQKQINGEILLPRWWYEYKTEKFKNKNEFSIEEYSNVDLIKKIQNSKKNKNIFTLEKKKLVGKEKEEFLKVSEEIRHNTILNAYINYNKPSGKIEHKLNQLGFIRFTTYPKRIQKIINSTIMEYPLRSLMLITLQNQFDSLDTIYNQNLFTKNWYNLGLNDDNIPGFSPLENLEELMTIPLFKKETYQLY